MYTWNAADSVQSQAVWQETYVGLHGAGRLIVGDGVVDGAPWAGQLQWQRSGTFGVALCGGTRVELSRQARHIRADPRSTCELLVPLAGAASVEQGGSAAELRSGFMALCDLDRPLDFAHGQDLSSIALIIPGREIERRSPALLRTPPLLNGDEGLGRLIRRTVVTLQQERERLSETSFDMACEHLLDLVCLAAEGATDSAPAAQRAQVEAQIRRYVRRYADDRDLNVTRIAHALGWSVRYVQEVLKGAHTTSRDLIRHERLQLARSRLTSAPWAGYSVAHIAHACGFSSHATFSTAFRQEFGMTPRDARGFGGTGGPGVSRHVRPNARDAGAAHPAGR